jgi:hypothetical protein
MSDVKVTTWTIMSVSRPGQPTVAIESKITESVGSALEHVRGMGLGKPEPVYDVRSGGWRWTWETHLPNGVVNVDTVRIY